MENQRIFISSILGAIVVAIINAVPFLNFVNCFCCIGIVAGGIIALLHYDRSFDTRDYVSVAVSITIGITTGIFSAFISLLFEWIIFLQFGNWTAELFLKIAENMEEIPPAVEQMIEAVKEEKQYGFLWTYILLRNLIVMPVFCLTGSLITRAYLNKDRSFNNIT